MSYIYKNAERVIVWLGREDGELAPANDSAVEWAVHTLSQSIPNHDFGQVYRSWLAKPAPGESQSEQSARFKAIKLERWTSDKTPCLRDINVVAWSAIQTVFERSWFSRNWTFQEIILARKAIVCCGQLEIVWDDLVNWCNALSGARGLHDSLAKSTLGYWPYHAFNSLIEKDLLVSHTSY